MSGSHLSKEFFDLVKSIGESRSKQEEDKIIVNEVHTLKAKMAAREVPSKKMKEYLIRMIYVEMLGHDASFGHIHAVKMAHNRHLLEKRVGYLAVSLTLHKDHSFMLLLINTLQTDLKSDNYLEASMALTVVAKLVNAETIPAILPLVVRLLDHKEGNVKKKAVMVLHRFHQIDPQTIAGLGGPIRKALCDSNISVMAASLNLFLDLCTTKPSAYKDLVPDFVSILKQVIEHRLPRDYDYHRMCAPWVQLKLLQILAVLGASDKNASEGMYEILREVMKRADIGINCGYAIVYESVRTATTIYPEPSLIEESASAVSRFITSDNHNLKYLGINALAAIVQIDSKYAAEHQLIVIDCLSDPDETLKRKTLDLLYSMTNPANVTVIVQKLIQYLQTATDSYLRSELVSRINQLAEKYAPSNEWFITTMTGVFEMSGATSGSVGTNPNSAGGNNHAVAGSEKIIKNEMSQSILRLISESANQLLLNYPNGQVPAGEDDIRTYAVDTYIALLAAKKKAYSTALPDILIQVIAWVLGEYGHVSATTSPVDVLNLLVQLMERQVDSPALTKSWILSAIVKLSSKMLAIGQQIPANVIALVTKYENSLFVDLQQRAFEFSELLKNNRTFTSVVPSNNCFDLEFQVDDNLTFLDSYVETALRNGAKPYNNDPTHRAKLAESAAEHLYAASGGHGKGLRFQAYEAPAAEVATAPVPQPSFATGNGHAFNNPYGASSAAHAPAPAAAAAPPAEDGLRLGSSVARRWGPSGYNDPDAQAAAAPAQPAYAQPTIAAMPSAAQQAQTAAAAAYARQQEEQREKENAAAREKERKARELAAKPRELTEKEKLAQSLFAGVAGGAAAAPVAKPRAPVVAQQPRASFTQPAAHQPAPTPAAAAHDFLGGLIDASVSQPAAAAKPASSADSLDLLFGGPSTSPATSAARPAASGGDLFDIMGGGSAAAAAPAPSSGGAPLFDNMHISTPASSSAQPNLFSSPPTAAPAAAAPALLDDPFGFGLAPAPAASPSGGDLFSQLGEGSTKFGFAGSHMAGQLSGLPKAQNGAETTAVSNAQVQLSSIKALSGDSTVVAIFLSNKTAQPMHGVSLSFTVASGFAVSLNADGGAQTSSSGAQHGIQISSLAARSTVTLLVALNIRDFSAFTQPLQLSSGALNLPGAAPVSFAIELSPTDFLRPNQMKTDAYGVAWKSLTEEVKSSARPSTCNTPAEFMQRAEKQVNAFPVQTIGQENICAARFVATAGIAIPPQQLLVLVHGKVHSHVDLIVRSKSREFSTLLAKQLAVVFK